jgi:hypothetical protein
MAASKEGLISMELVSVTFCKSPSSEVGIKIHITFPVLPSAHSNSFRS